MMDISVSPKNLLKHLVSVFILLFAMVVMSVETTQAQTVTWPFGSAYVETSTETVSSGTDSIDITNRMNYFKYKFTGDATIAAKPTNVRKGGFLFLELTCDGTSRTVSFGSNLQATSESLTINKTSVAAFIYNGNKWMIYSIKQVD